MCATNHFALPTKSNIPGRVVLLSPIVATDSNMSVRMRSIDAIWEGIEEEKHPV